MKKGVKFTERQLIDLYGIMFSVAYSDGELDKEELKSIYEIINTEKFSAEGIQQVQNYIVQNPDFHEITQRIKNDIGELRYTCYLNGMEVAYSNDIVTKEQEELFRYLRKQFKISDVQDKKIREFVIEAKRLRERGIDDKYAKDALKSAVSGLGAVGVPVAAVYFSGSVIGLSAAGITSGLAALGLGFGMIPGIGVAILIGTGIFIALSKVLDVGGKKKKQTLQKEKERRAQQVIKNLQDTINNLIERIQELEKKAKEAQANKEAIEELTKRLTMLKQIVANKKRSIA